MIASNFEYLRKIVQDKAAIVLTPGKEYLLETRLIPLVQKNGFQSLDQMVDAMKTSGWNALHQQVVDAMTTNETLFFRDIHPFETLKKTIIPELIIKRAADKKLYIWCMACSSGQEPYSIAMLLREHFPILNGWSIFLLASDLSDKMIERTKAGVFDQLEVNRGLPATYLIKYFEKKDSMWQIKPQIKSMVGVQKINLIQAWPALPKMDLIFLRNVLIYFDSQTKKNILAKIRQSLKPDGYLFLGGAETTIGLDDQFERTVFEKTTCYRLKQT